MLDSSVFLVRCGQHPHSVSLQLVSAPPGWFGGGMSCWKMSVKKFEISLMSKSPLANVFWMFGEFFAATLMISCVVSEFMVMLDMLLESTLYILQTPPLLLHGIGLMTALVALYLFR